MFGKFVFLLRRLVCRIRKICNVNLMDFPLATWYARRSFSLPLTRLVFMADDSNCISFRIDIIKFRQFDGTFYGLFSWESETEQNCSNSLEIFPVHLVVLVSCSIFVHCAFSLTQRVNVSRFSRTHCPHQIKVPENTKKKTTKLKATQTKRSIFASLNCKQQSETFFSIPFFISLLFGLIFFHPIFHYSPRTVTIQLQ